MNCRDPFPANDPFLPARDARRVTCSECGHQHRDDHPCTCGDDDEGPGGLFVVVAVVLCLAVAFGLLVATCALAAGGRP